MPTALIPITWDLAHDEFVLHLQPHRAKKTVRYYDVQILQLSRWAEENDVPFGGFGKRDLDRYKVFRQQQGKSRMTLRHDGLCAKNDLIDRSPSRHSLVFR